VEAFSVSLNLPAQRNETETILKLFAFSFILSCGQFNGARYNDSGKQYKSVRITINQPGTKSNANPYPDPTANCMQYSKYSTNNNNNNKTTIYKVQ